MRNFIKTSKATRQIKIDEKLIENPRERAKARKKFEE